MKTFLSYQIPPAPVYYYQKHVSGINKLAFLETQNSTNLFTAGRDGLLMNYSLSGKVKHQSCYAGHIDWINDVCFLEDGQFIVSASSDCSLNVWRTFPTAENVTENGNFETSSLHKTELKESQSSVFTFPLVNLGKTRSCNKSTGTCFECPPNHCAYFGHSDYVNCVASAKKARKFISGGLDRRLIVWDADEIRKCAEYELSDQNSPTFAPLEVYKTESVYAVDYSEDGKLVAVTAGNAIKIIDTRSRVSVFTLNGHSDSVRAIMMSSDCSTIISASSDSAIRLWSLASNRTISVLDDFNLGSVWCLAKDNSEHGDNFKSFFAGTKAGEIRKFSYGPKSLFHNIANNNVYYSRENGYSCCLIAKEENSITSLALQGDLIWAATDRSSTLNSWRNISLLAKEETKQSNSRNYEQSGSNDILNLILKPVQATPETIIKGVPAIVKCQLLDDRRHLLTQSINNEICLWDIIQCKNIRHFKSNNFDMIFDELNSLSTYAGNWCSVDISLGFITVVIDENRFCDCEAYADELKLDQPFPVDQRVNIGKWVICSLLKKWKLASKNPHEKHRGSLKSPRRSIDDGVLNIQSYDDESLPSSAASTVVTPTSKISPTAVLDFRPTAINFDDFVIVTITEDAGEKVCTIIRSRLFVGMLAPFHIELTYNLALWMSKCAKEEFTQTNQVKLGFKLEAHPQSGLPNIPSGPQNLTANRMIRMRKLLQHAVDKAGLIDSPRSPIRIAGRPEDWLEICCENKPLSPFATLGTIKHRLTNGKDPVLYYRPLIKEI